MPYRSLTKGETDLARKIFGNSIDYGAVRLYDRRIFPPPIQAKGRAMAGKNAVSFPGEAYSPDFSAESDPVRKSVFIHELVHVWQHQNKVLNTYKEFGREMLRHKFRYGKAYFYQLEAGKDLTAYNLEQQAGIIQDYFLLTEEGTSDSYKNRRLNSEKDAALAALYENVLKDFLINPGYAGKNSKPPSPPAAKAF